MADIIKTIPLSGTKSGTIIISNLKEPYGVDSNDVVSIGISLNKGNEEPDWKAHIPYENIDEVIAGLKEAKDKHK